MTNCNNNSRSNNIEVRSNFLLFVKILFRCLEKSEDELLVEQAKLVVYNCRMRKQQQQQQQQGAGDDNDDIRRSIQRELQDLVGQSTWEQAERLTIYYLKKQDADRRKKTSLSGNCKQVPTFTPSSGIQAPVAQTSFSIPGLGHNHIESFNSNTNDNNNNSNMAMMMMMMQPKLFTFEPNEVVYANNVISL